MTGLQVLSLLCSLVALAIAVAAIVRVRRAAARMHTRHSMLHQALTRHQRAHGLHLDPHERRRPFDLEPEERR